MASHSTRSGYVYTGGVTEPDTYTVGRSQQMRAALDNNKYLLETKIDGLRGATYDNTDVDPDGLVILHSVNHDHSDGGNAATSILIDVSAGDYGNTNLGNLSSMLKNRFIHIRGSIYKHNDDAEADDMPGGATDWYLDCNGGSGWYIKGTFYSGPGWNGTGGVTYAWDETSDTDHNYFRVDPTSGDLVVDWNSGAYGATGWSWQLTIELSEKCEVT